MKQYVYYVGYSYTRGFGSFAFSRTCINKFDDVEFLIDFVRREISRECPHITYDEIVIISLSQIPLVPQKEGFFKRAFSFFKGLF